MISNETRDTHPQSRQKEQGRKCSTMLGLRAVSLLSFWFHACVALRINVSPLAAVRGTSSSSMSMSSALVVQNKGGGHGELGYHLALDLAARGIDVTLLQDSAANKSKEPFASYGDLEAKGVKVEWGDLAAGVGSALPDGPFDYVFDNFAKDVATCSDLAGKAKEWGVKNYVYVSSAGMYKDSDEVPLVETCEAKETGQRTVEKHAESLGLPWTSFRPQYIYGPKTNKRDYLDYFFDRVVWKMRPLPVPVHGDQFVSITHAADVASMLASVVGNDKAPGQVFNCGSDRYITYNELVRQVAKVTGAEEDIEKNYYDPADFDLKKGWFPFRNNHFFVSSDKAQSLLGWKPKHNLLEDLKWYYEGYKAAGKEENAPDFTQDDEINVGNNAYIPWSYKKAVAENDPQLVERLERIQASFDPFEASNYSGLAEAALRGDLDGKPDM